MRICVYAVNLWVIRRSIFIQRTTRKRYMEKPVKICSFFNHTLDKARLNNFLARITAKLRKWKKTLNTALFSGTVWFLLFRRRFTSLKLENTYFRGSIGLSFFAQAFFITNFLLFPHLAREMWTSQHINPVSSITAISMNYSRLTGNSELSLQSELLQAGMDVSNNIMVYLKYRTYVLLFQ